MNMAWPIGVIIGPMIGGFISDSLGWSAMMSALIVTYICGLVPVLFTAPHERVHERMSFQRMSFQIDRSIIKPLLFYSFFQFFVGMGFGLTNTILPTYVTDILGMTKETIGIFWSICFGVTFLATQIPGGRLAERFHLRKILILGVALAPLFIITIPSTRSILVFEALYTAMTTLWNLSVPAGNVLFLSLLPNDRRGFYTGVMQTIAMASWTVAPSIGTFLYDFYGPALPFYASAISFILATITLIGVKENKVDR